MAPKATPGTPSRSSSRRISAAASTAPLAKAKAAPTPKKAKTSVAGASNASVAAASLSDEVLEVEAAESSNPAVSAKDAVNGLAQAAGLKRKRPTARPRQSVAKMQKERLNQVPKPPSHDGPARSLFIFGTGDMAAFGLGPDELGEIARPRLHKWFQEGIEEGKFGAPGQGIERAVAGGMHSLVVDEAGKVWSWGVNDNAALGRLTANVPDPENPGQKIDSEELESWPMAVTALEEEEFRAVKAIAGDSISIVVGEEGDVRAWGSFRSAEGLLGFDGSPHSSKTQFKPIPLPSLAQHRFAAVACGTDHVLALTVDGTVFVWGNGQQNQLGRRIIERRKLNGLSPERLALRNIVTIGAGHYHSFAVDKDGRVYAWGLNSLRQTGVSEDRGGREDIIQVPTLVDALDPSLHNGAKVVSISGGEHHSLFLFDDGTVWACGRADASQLGLGAEHPAMKDLKERADEERQALLDAKKEKAVKAAVDAGEDANLDEIAQFEAPPAVDEFVPEPVQIFFPPKPTADSPAPTFEPYPTSAEEYTPHPMVSISAGTRHNLAVSADGNVYAWGYGNQCQLGLGPDLETAEVPMRVRSKSLNDYKVVDASAGGLHCILVAVPKDAPQDA